jgi:hypothetical protein
MVNHGSPDRQGPKSRRDPAAGPHRPIAMPSGARSPELTHGRGVATAIAEGRAPARARRPVDVICCGMYRACSTWQYEVVAHLLEDHGHGRRLGYLTGEQYARLVRSEAAAGASTPGDACRVFKSHEGDRSFARALEQGRALAVYAYRDVRDVVFSLMHKRGLTFEQLLRQGMIDQILANDRFWTQQPRILIQRYEHLLADPVAGVLALASHLGFNLGEEEADRIARGYSLESNKARSEALRRRLEQVGLDLSQAANAQICDPTTLLHWNHVRGGGPGSWTTLATPRQRAVLDRLFRPWLQARHYRISPAGTESRPLGRWQPGLGERIGIEVDLARGRLSYLLRAASLRFPRLAHAIKRLLGIPTGGDVGATVWSESHPAGAEKGAAGQSRP